MKKNEKFRRSNERTCHSKRTFNSFAEASAFNKRSRHWLRGNKKAEDLHVYRCEVCRQWHIGHPFIKDYREDYRND